MASTKIYVVGTRGNYLIGAQARTVYSKIRGAADIRIHRSKRENVAGDVNMGLRALSVELRPYEKITIDDDAWVEVCRNGEPRDSERPKLIEMSEFLMVPFKNYMGIVLPYKLLMETEDKLLYRANVIDPIEDYEFFRPAI